LSAPTELAANQEPATVAAVVLNWNGWQETVLCLRSLLEADYPGLRIVVLDNGSEDGSLAHLRQWAHGRAGLHVTEQPEDFATVHTPGLLLLRSEENLGFAGGCNLAARTALGLRPDYVLFLNNDVVVAPNAVPELVRIAGAAGASLVGAYVLDRATGRVLFRGRRWPQHLFGFGKSSEPLTRPAYWSSDDIDGCAFIATARLLEARVHDSGHVFDPALFIYWEDTDFATYARSRGHRCVVARDATVHHGVAQSAGGAGNSRGFYYLTRNRIRLANRWLNPPMKFVFHAYFVPSRVALQILRVRHFRLRVARAVFEGLVDGYGGVWGKWRRHADKS
jgi:GT2 family glycosyltransferase